MSAGKKKLQKAAINFRKSCSLRQYRNYSNIITNMAKFIIKTGSPEVTCTKKGELYAND